MSDMDSLIRERLAAAAAFDVVTDPRRVREDVTRRQRHIRRRHRVTALLGVLAVAGIAAGVVSAVDRDPGGDVAVQTTDAPREPSNDAGASNAGARPHFLPAPGWETSNGGLAATAANVALGPNSLKGAFPGDTLERLKEGEVVLWVMFQPTSRFPTQDGGWLPRELPLSLDDAQPGESFEGQPGHIWADRILAQVNGYYIDVWVFYGADDPTALPAEPTAETRAAAQEQLARFVVPARP
jgi:hypothetical protein